MICCNLYNFLQQVEFGLGEPRWYLLWLWYDFTEVDGDTSVHFIVLDAMSILLPRYEWEEQIQWYNDTLSSSTADWKVIVVQCMPFMRSGCQDRSIDLKSVFVFSFFSHFKLLYYFFSFYGPAGKRGSIAFQNYFSSHFQLILLSRFFPRL